MKLNQMVIGLSIFCIATASHATQSDTYKLRNTREQVAKQYIIDLQQADYKAIAKLFEKNGIVISTSRGKANAKEFFYSFLPNVASANTELHQVFSSNDDIDQLTARFHLDYTLKNGEKGNGEYVDEFVFAHNTAKLAAVYMFENTKFNLNKK